MFQRRRSARLLLLRNKETPEQSTSSSRSNVNYMHKDNLCYTKDDNVLVYNLYVYNIPKSITEEDLKAYFSCYGEIHSISVLHRKRKNGDFRYGFVNFKNAESAARALRKIGNQFKIMNIKAAHGYKQPTMEISNGDQNCDNDKVPPNAILNLNDDCLLHIFSFLTFPEKLMMLDLSKRFETIFRMSLKKTLNINEILDLPYEITLFDIRQIFIKCGNSIEHISLNYRYHSKYEICDRFISYIPKLCPYLKTLKLKDFKKIPITTLCNLKSINRLELTNCNVDDDGCLHLSQLPELISLNLSENHRLTGKYLSKFEKLQTLLLFKCNRIEDSYVVEFSKSLKFLKELAIEELNEEILPVVFENMRNLEKLFLYAPNAEKVHEIANLQNLKSLSLKAYHTGRNFTNAIRKLAIKNQLETLCLPEATINFPLLRLIPTIKSIKKIKVKYRKLDNEFLENCTECKFLEYLYIGWIKDFDDPVAILNLIDKSKSIHTLHLNMFWPPEDHIIENFILNVIDIIKKEKRFKLFKLVITGIRNDIFEIRLKNLVPSNLSNIFELSFTGSSYYDFN